MVIKSDARLFSGGADVNMFRDKDIHQTKAMFTEGMRTIAALEDAPFPVVAAVQGLCYAAGLELALACDFIYASEDAVFSQVEAFIGATTFLGGVYRLAERCGPAIAREIVYTADDYSAQQFADWHIVNKVVPGAELHSTVLSLAKRIAAGPKLAHATTKRLVRHALAHGSRSTDEILLHDATWLLPSQDMQNAVSRLVEVGARRFRATRNETVFEGR
jgi:enoyl-CoA hydratase/carnithine racemase